MKPLTNAVIDMRTNKRLTGEAAVAALLLSFGHQHEREFKFHPVRRWRFDFVLLPVSLKIAIEVEGGVWSRGRHTRGAGYIGDMEKYIEAALMGWTVLRYPASKVTDQIIKDIERIKYDRRQNTSS